MRSEVPRIDLMFMSFREIQQILSLFYAFSMPVSITKTQDREEIAGKDWVVQLQNCHAQSYNFGLLNAEEF